MLLMLLAVQTWIRYGKHKPGNEIWKAGKAKQGWKSKSKGESRWWRWWQQLRGGFIVPKIRFGQKVLFIFVAADDVTFSWLAGGGNKPKTITQIYQQILYVNFPSLTRFILYRLLCVSKRKAILIKLFHFWVNRSLSIFPHDNQSAKWNEINYFQYLFSDAAADYEKTFFHRNYSNLTACCLLVALSE